MSLGAEISVIMPIINAPFRLYYAYNPLRLYERPYCNTVLPWQSTGSCSAELITRDLFPPGGAGDYTYQEAIQGLRLALPVPRAQQDLPADRFNDVLTSARHQPERKAALKSGLPASIAALFLLPRFDPPPRHSYNL